MGIDKLFFVEMIIFFQFLLFHLQHDPLFLCFTTELFNRDILNN